MAKWFFCVLLLLLGLTGCLGGGTGPVTYVLTMEVEGQGDVMPAAGPHAYPRDEVVDVSAVAAPGWDFAGWVGEVADPASPETTVVMDKNKTVRAVFQEEEPAPGTERASHDVNGVFFHLRLAPAASIPVRSDDSGEAAVEQAFWLAETEVTYELWYEVHQWALQNEYHFVNVGREGSGGPSGQPPGVGGSEPVTEISWRDAIVWCNALSQRLGMQPVYTHNGTVIKDASDAGACDNAVQQDGSGFRLPTNVEWELAARYIGPVGAAMQPAAAWAIEKDGFFWSPGNFASGASGPWTDDAANQDVAWYNVNSGSKTQAVGLKNANGIGAYDMSGNVWNWTFSPQGLNRIYRGGSWYDSASSLQVGGISSTSADFTRFQLGFRPARSAP